MSSPQINETGLTFSFVDKTLLYTGAAGGLGLNTTLKFLEAGAQVVAVDNDPKKSASLTSAAEKRGCSERLITSEADMSDLAGFEDAITALSNKVGGFDIVINNAAIYPSKAFEDYTIEEHQEVQRVNVDAGILCVKTALPHMRKNKCGRIINISSVTFFGGWANLSPYVQSKGALIGLTRAWAREFGPYGISVNAVAPGAFPTDAEKIHPDPEGYQQFVLDHQAVKRRGSPDDIANLLMFLSADQSGFITGQTINIDGGWVMQ